MDFRFTFLKPFFLQCFYILPCYSYRDDINLLVIVQGIMFDTLSYILFHMPPFTIHSSNLPSPICHHGDIQPFKLLFLFMCFITNVENIKTFHLY